MQQSLVVLDLCLRKTRAGKSHDYPAVIVFEKLYFQHVFRPHENAKRAFSNSSGLKNVFEKLRFRDGLVWTLDCNHRNKAAFSNVSGVVQTALQDSSRLVTSPKLKRFVPYELHA